MKNIVLAGLLATTLALTSWQAPDAADARDYLYGQRLYSLGDYAGALTVWEPLAKQGDARAQFSMAVLYLKGRGVPRDEAKAMDWARQAAEQGDKPGQSLLHRLQKIAARATVTPQPEHHQITEQRGTKIQNTELERIEAAVGDILQQIAGRIAKDGTLRHGGLRAAHLADAIEVTIPDIVIRAADGGAFDIGAVIAHVRRLDARHDDITLALPDRIRFRKEDGSNGNISIKKRLAKLRWDRQLATSTEFEFRLGELVFSFETGGEMGRIGEVLVQAEVLEDKGLWTGPLRFALTRVHMTNGGDTTLQLERFSLVMDLRGLDLPAFHENPGLSRAKSQTRVGDNPSLQGLFGLANGFALRAKIDKLAMWRPMQGEFRLATADYSLDLSSDDGHMLNLALSASHFGLANTGGAAPDGMVPRDLDIALALEKVPSETVINVGIGAVIEVALLGSLSSGPQVFQRLRKELGAAETVLRLKRVNISAQDYHIAMSASLLADLTAKAGVIGDGELRITGLRKLLATVQPYSEPESTGDHKIHPSKTLTATGKPIDGSAGRLFNLNLRPDGQLTVNGDPVLSLTPFGDTGTQ
ncbi:MAG: tetratricopeptide repeat protein [Proteobacteria bacterium]|nr:tetratricopeptide repeat protein [Pseudomonadota bacterium]